MSQPILPLAVWQSGTNENSIPANDNALRLEALSRLALGVENSPTSSDDGDVFIVGAAPSGAFASFDEGDIAIAKAGNWYAWAPVAGLVVNLDGVLIQWTGSSWTALSGGAGGGDRSVVTALAIASGVVNIDCSLGSFFTLALTADVTSVTFTNLPADGMAQAIAVRIRQDATGGRAFNLPSSFKAILGSDTAVQSAANAYTILHIETFDQGARWEYSMKAGAP